jgi:hypothetical protein
MNRSQYVRMLMEGDTRAAGNGINKDRLFAPDGIRGSRSGGENRRLREHVEKLLGDQFRPLR